MVNLHILDKLVTEHLQLHLECVKVVRHENFHTPPSDADIIVALYLIRSHVMYGRIDAAVKLYQTICSRPIEDARLLFNIRMHKLVELLYAAESIKDKHDRSAFGAYPTALKAALSYSQQLAVYALDAFPEAYEAFVDSMQLFLTDENTSSFGFIDTRRRALADELVSVMRLVVSARLSHLSFLLRYLLVVYIPFRTPVHDPQDAGLVPSLQRSVQSLADFRLPPDAPPSRIVWRVDGAPVQCQGMRPAFEEADVQALRERVCISREEAIHALAFADGDLPTAMRNELARVVTGESFIQASVIEYCAARGIPLLQFVKCDCPREKECVLCCVGHGREFNIIDESLHAHVSKDGRFILVRDGSVSPAVMQVARVMQALREAISRDEGAQAVLDGLKNAVSLASFSVADEPRLFFRLAQRQCMLHMESGCLRLALQVLRMEIAPLAKEREELFAQLEATVIVLACGRVNSEGSSLDVGTDGSGREQMDGLVDHPNEDLSLYPDLACDAWEMVEDHCAVEAIAEEVFTALQKRHGEPKLVSLLQGLVDTHSEWEKRNLFCDRLATEFMVHRIVQRQEIDAPEDGGSAPGRRRRRRRCGRLGRSGGRSGYDGSRREEGRDEDAVNDQVCDLQGSQPHGEGGNGDGDGASQLRESMILTLMEFLAVSRGEALSIIRTHPNANSAQAILDSLLGSM